jgi:formylglycine-generating enzyme required for sulfatase activity
VLPGEPVVTMSFRYIPPGEFSMGSPLSEAGRDPDEAQVQVTLTKGFWFAVDECRQDVFERVTGANPALLPNPEAPVQRVSWDDAQRFISRINTLVPALNSRLPTEAEWEHAARAGETAIWIGPRGAVEPSELARIGWFTGGEDPGLGARAAGRRQPNPLGLHDLHGNVWEWCQDRYGFYSPVAITDPIGFESELRVARGGSWGENSRGIRLANRLPLEPGLRSWFVGFRLAVPAELPPDVQLDHNRDAGDFESQIFEPTGSLHPQREWQASETAAAPSAPAPATSSTPTAATARAVDASPSVTP